MILCTYWNMWRTTNVRYFNHLQQNIMMYNNSATKCYNLLLYKQYNSLFFFCFPDVDGSFSIFSIIFPLPLPGNNFESSVQSVYITQTKRVILWFFIACKYCCVRFTLGCCIWYLIKLRTQSWKTYINGPQSTNMNLTFNNILNIYNNDVAWNNNPISCLFIKYEFFVLYFRFTYIIHLINLIAYTFSTRKILFKKYVNLLFAEVVTSMLVYTINVEIDCFT